jgi:membrane-bound lytic murein transglycosylase D
MLFCGQLFAQHKNLKCVADDKQLNKLDTASIKLKYKLYQHADPGDLNIYGFEENEVPIYADSVYAYRLSILETQIQMPYNEFVRRYIDMYTIKRRKLTSRMINWSSYYFPIFEEALDKADMPLELKYMAVIESALNPNATSPVGAAGLWQFMPATGRMYGLRTGNQFDERRELNKSTEAAIKYLRNSYNIYGDWLLVIASYNCGPGNVNKAIKRANGSKNFWVIQEYLPKETRGYVPAFIAAAYAMTYASEHNIYPNIDQELPLNLDTVYIDNRYTFNQIAAELGMSTSELRYYNPQLRANKIPFTQEPIAITLPYAKSILFSKITSDTGYKFSFDHKLIASNVPQTTSSKSYNSTKGNQTYTIRPGDVLASIAKKFNVTVSELKKWNDLNTNRITAGKKLIVKPLEG